MSKSDNEKRVRMDDRCSYGMDGWMEAAIRMSAVADNV